MPPRQLEPGETLITEGDEQVSLYELRSGTLDIVRNGATVATVAEPGAMFGEMSLLLDRPAEFAVVLARLLARRVDVMTGYLADLRHQYGDHEGGLGMIDEVLASLSHSPRVEVDPGSERETDAPY
jgi:CRP-like cAMP-binding protein